MPSNVKGLEVTVVKQNISPSEDEGDYFPDVPNYNKNIWTPEDEGAHFPIGCEWWMFYVSLELEDGTYWDVSATFQYETEETEDGTVVKYCILLMYYFSREEEKCYDFSSYSWEPVFTFKKEIVDLWYNNCTMKGLYPSYNIHLENYDKTFILDIQMNATSLPHWAAQEGGNGVFPWGLTIGKYGYISRLDVSGALSIETKESNVTGIGYFEHSWGDFAYSTSNPFEASNGFINNLKKLIPLAKWYFSEQTTDLPDTFRFTTDNIFGYDWAWASFDNGWSLQFGIFHIMDCISEGPVLGALSLTKDGETYWDFADINIKYGKRHYLERADVYLPLDIELTATKGDKVLFLRLNSTTSPHKTVSIAPLSSFSCGIAGIHTAGIIEGYYEDNEGKVPLNGICAIGPYRHLMKTKYNELKIEFLRQPKGLGFSFELKSNLFGFEMLFKRQLLPYPERTFYIKPLNNLPPNIQNEERYSSTNSLFVGGDGPNNYSCIQDAIDNASNGDTVFVYSGIYNESLLINKTINLIGENKNKVFLQINNQDGIKVTADNVEITGFTIDLIRANHHDISLIHISTSGNYIHDNNIIKSDFWGVFGIFIFNASNNIIENNSITDNEIGIWLCRAYNNIIRYNNIESNRWTGIWLWPFSGNNIISNNNFIKNEEHVDNSDKLYRNQWDENYWDDYVGFKLKIFENYFKSRNRFVPYRISLFESDRSPAPEPYDI